MGQKKPLEPKHVWSIRVRLEIARSWRDLVIFNLAIDSYAIEVIDFALADLVGRLTIRLRPLLLTGDPGGGKSRFARRLGEALRLASGGRTHRAPMARSLAARIGAGTRPSRVTPSSPLRKAKLPIHSF
jgi:MoxR-like ATPase